MERDSEADQMAYAHALVAWGDVGGYDYETLWDVCTVAALGMPFDKAQWRKVTTLSGGEQKRVVLEALLRGPEEVLLLDEPDNYLDVPGKIWLEGRIRESAKTILFISHDRELLDNTELKGRVIAGLPHDAQGFIPVDEHCAVHGLADVYAAGDGIAWFQDPDGNVLSLTEF